MTTTTVIREASLPVLRPSRGRLAGAWRLVRRKPVGAVAGLLCILLILVAVFADQLKTRNAEALTSPPRKLAAPSREFPFGTDNLFRDMYSRTVVGSRISLGIGFSAVAVGTVLGTVFGIVSAYAGGWIDMVVNRAMDTVMAFPPLILAMFAVSIFRPSFWSVTIVIGVIITPATARIVRGAVLGIRNLQYVEAAQAIGASHLRIMRFHILPNVAAPIIVIASIQIGNAILAEAALSFLSLGIATAARPSWGMMLQDTRAYWEQAWWTAVVPGAAISLAVLSFNLFGDALRDVLDPRLRGS
jgi:peptide/nickel transport system permease protein